MLASCAQCVGPEAVIVAALFVVLICGIELSICGSQ